MMGASSVFVSCLANLYSFSGNTIYDNGASITYLLYSGIKQGLPLSPYLFLFYIDDVFAYLESYFSGGNNLLEDLHILVHADDANLIALSKDLMIKKLRRMLDYCNINSIILQLIKCHFTVINGSEEDYESLLLSSQDSVSVGYQPHLEILGSHISGCVPTDLLLHMKKRFPNVIKYFNYVRSNDVAPVVVKLQVLEGCVASTLCYNCEAFGPDIPKGLEEVYMKMLRAALGVRHNAPKNTVLIESGCLPLKAVIHARQLKFFRRFKKSIASNSVREKIFNFLLENSTRYLKHYVKLDTKYTSDTQLFSDYVDEVKKNIRDLASNKEKHYKFWVYTQINPDLVVSPFLSRMDVVGKSIIKFRLGSHKLKIETGRWTNTPRELRLCSTCNQLEDEFHIIFDCVNIHRADLTEIPSRSLAALWNYGNVNTLFSRIRTAEYVS